MGRKVSIYLFLAVTLSLTACQKELDFSERDYKTLGTSAHDLLAGDTYASLLIEISYMPGFAPGSEAINDLNTFLNTYLNKPGGVTIIQKEIPGSGKERLSLTDIVKVEKQHRTAYSGTNRIAVHVLITDGTYATDENSFATSYWNTSFCLFGKTIAQNAGGPGRVSVSSLVSTLLQHEFGHLLGLVGQGSPMVNHHKDEPHGAHCDEATCLMYYGIETADSGSGTTGVPMLDAACRADLKANGGK